MVWSYPNIERMSALKVDASDLGRAALYCHACDYQILDAAHKPQCPDCGGPLYTTRVTQELLDLIAARAN